MPTYEYRCRDCGHEFEIQQSFADAALTTEMICAVFESHRQQGARVSFPLGQRENALGLLK